MTRLPARLELEEQAEPVDTAIPESESERTSTSPDRPGNAALSM